MALATNLSPFRPRRALLYTGLTVGVIAWAMPVIIIITSSLTPSSSTESVLGGTIVADPTLDNFATVWTENPILRHYMNSLLITIPTVVMVVLLSALAAYGFARLRVPARNLTFLVLALTLMLPYPALMVPIVRLNQWLGLQDTYLGLILPYTALGIPFGVVILRGFFESFPNEILEAARLDGCSSFKILWRILLPVAKPALAVVVIWQFITSWNEFVLALLTIQSNERMPLTVVPILYAGEYQGAPGALFAVLSYITVPALLVFAFMQRHLVSGLTSGAVRG